MNLIEYAEKALTKPDDFAYWGDPDMFETWGFSGFNIHGQSSILDEANYKTICSDLLQKFPEDFRIESFKHWAVGFAEQLVCRILKNPGEVTEDNITDAFKDVISWHIELEDYPIADEALYSDMEALAIIDFINDLPYKNMFDEDDIDWQMKLLHSLEDNMNEFIYPDSGYYPKDDVIQMAAYLAEIWNPEEVDLWEEFCSENNLEFPPKKKNPNQLSLFEN